SKNIQMRKHLDIIYSMAYYIFCQEKNRGEHMPSKPKEARKTKKDLMVELLRDAILSGELAPGERLLQEELADRFDVSPTPVREAIQQLVAEGVLSHSPYKGVQVAEVEVEDVQEIYLIRAALE